jgi:hypothetical protein
MPANLKAIEDSARYILNKHGLEDWTFKFTNTHRQLGLCTYSKKTISVSKIACEHNTMEDIRDIILHEVAHALVGGRHGHDKVWRRQCRLLGCKLDSSSNTEGNIKMPSRTKDSWVGDNGEKLDKGDSIGVKFACEVFQMEFVGYKKSNIKYPFIVRGNMGKGVKNYRVALYSLVFDGDLKTISTGDLASSSDNKSKKGDTTMATKKNTTPKKASSKKAPAEKAPAKKTSTKKVTPTLDIDAKPKATKKTSVKSKPKADKKPSQTDILRDLIRSGKSKEDVIASLASKFNNTVAWATGRVKMYENYYGEMGKDDKKL